MKQNCKGRPAATVLYNTSFNRDSYPTTLLAPRPLVSFPIRREKSRSPRQHLCLDPDDSPRRAQYLHSARRVRSRAVKMETGCLSITLFSVVRARRTDQHGFSHSAHASVRTCLFG